MENQENEREEMRLLEIRQSEGRAAGAEVKAVERSPLMRF